MKKTDFPINQALLKQDLYQAVNGAWLKQAVIPADHASVGGFMDLVDDIDKTLMHDSEAFRTGQTTPTTPELAEYTKFYRLAMDFTARDQAGATPLRPLIDRVTHLTSYAELNQQLSDWILTGLPAPLSLELDPDMKNATTMALYASGPGLFLPDKTYYQNNNPAYEQLMPIFAKMSARLLELTGVASHDAQAIVKQAQAFDAKVAKWVKSAEEAADYSDMYHPYTAEQFAHATSALDLSALLNALVDQVPEKIIVTEPDFFTHLDELLRPDNFENLKAWLLVKTVNRFSNYLSEEFRQVGGQFSRALAGKKTAVKPEKTAYYLAAGTFDQVVGDYYGKRYFGPQAKADVHHMVKAMIDVYQNRLAHNEWLSPKTKQMAQKKLANLGIQVGYPDQLDPLYQLFHVDEQQSLLENTLNIIAISQREKFAQWNQPVQRTRWEMSANTVNAYYHPFKNIIVFPAAILQAPFYSLEQSPSANYGGIGAVIAHEISHAFDNNGSLFDETGNLHNWWTSADHEHFQQLADRMINQFDGLPFADGKVNGKLTVSENIADAGGLSCAEAAAKQATPVDLTEFFINWARIWRTKDTTEYQQLLLSIDVHAPSPLRASVQVKNLTDFYTTFKVTPTDGMYLAPEDRVQIW
ncbi:M13 family metallopeptidase [Fructilactobacillus florum]|uniref:Neutral endopeptidase n=1 Tax=Fructilactobacillus florum DSM 22689 = JCM 16035 TaxID=1423745 RepID=A0A0R2CQV8_9LACO|nr:M13-type metalloendopeptidase [Fructilactobacillus florum]KRM90572.1 Neutral endopeptidase [Fructilactobacillus florum DSM 22689 = JCM 16035]